MRALSLHPDTVQRRDAPLPDDDDPDRELRPYSSSDVPMISFAYSASSAEVGEDLPMSEAGLSAAAFLRFDLLPDFVRAPSPATSMPLGTFGSIHSSLSSVGASLSDQRTATQTRGHLRATEDLQTTRVDTYRPMSTAPRTSRANPPRHACGQHLVSSKIFDIGSITKRSEGQVSNITARINAGKLKLGRRDVRYRFAMEVNSLSSRSDPRIVSRKSSRSI